MAEQRRPDGSHAVARETGPDADRIADEASEESFPGSDPPSSWAGPDDPGGKVARISASAAGARKASDLITQQHHDIMSRLDEVSAEPTDDEGGRTRALASLLRALQIHEEAGQGLLHPAVSRSHSDIAGARLTEEKAIHDRALELTDAEIEGVQFDQLLEEFRTLLTSHFEAEETDELPLLADACDEVELRALGQALSRLNDASAHRREPIRRDDD